MRSLRTDRGGGLDRFYLGNLAVPVVTVLQLHVCRDMPTPVPAQGNGGWIDADFAADV